MTKMLLVLCMTAAVTVGGVLIWEAQATPLTGVTSSFAVIKSYSTVQKVGCIFGTHAVLRTPNGLVLSIRAQRAKRVFADLASRRATANAT
jgi:hypothetical protein